MNLQRGAALLLLISASSVQAGLFVEPTVGYTTGALSQSGVPAISLQAFIFGGRLGYRLANFKFGGDYSMGFGNGTQLGNTGDYKPTDLGVFLAYELPFRLSAYGSVFLSSKAKIQSSENPSDFSGRSYRVGLWWSGLNFCSIGFEAFYRIYSKYNGTEITNSIKGTTLGGSLSIPFP